MKIASFQKEFKKILDRKNFSSEVNPIRKNAFEQLVRAGLPSSKWDDLRFTNFSAFNKNTYRISETKDAFAKNRRIEFKLTER